MSIPQSPTRRRFLSEALGAGVGVAGATAFGPRFAAEAMAAAMSPSQVSSAPEGAKKPLRVAAIVTEVAYRLHPHVIIENFIEPYIFNGKRTESGCRIVSLYVDQVRDIDMSRAISRAYDIPIVPTIAEALTLGGKSLEVDGVLSIGEHGEYPSNEMAQMAYPHKRFFDEIVAVFEKTGQTAPVFNDKYLSYRFDWGREMVATADRLGFALMAGSSVPLAERRPPLELPSGAKMVEAVSIHGGPLERYDFHGFEVLCSMVEGRQGGETGIKAVRFLEGDALWNAADQGLWSLKLADAAFAAEIGPGKPSIRELVKTPAYSALLPYGTLIEFNDGLKGLVLRIGKASTRWNFACQLADDPQPRVTRFHVGPWENRNLFKALSHAIQTCFRDRESPYPIERTLMSTGLIDAMMISRHGKGMRLETPELAKVVYQPRDFAAMRENGESWRRLGDNAPQPRGVDSYDRHFLE